MAKYLASEQALSQLPGLGPQELADLPTNRPPIADEPIAITPEAEEIKPAPPSEAPPIEVKTPTIDTLQLYLDRVLPAAPQTIPTEWHSLIEVAVSRPQSIIQGEVGSGKTNLLHAIGQALKQVGQAPVYVRLSENHQPARKIQLSPMCARSAGPKIGPLSVEVSQPDDASDVRWQTAIKLIDCTTGNFPRRRLNALRFFPDHPDRASSLSICRFDERVSPLISGEFDVPIEC